MMRNPGVAIPVLVLPCALYALFALLIAGEAIDKDPSLGIFLFAAFSIMAVTMPALFGIGVTLALERDMGLLRLKRAQPAPPAAWLVAKIVERRGARRARVRAHRRRGARHRQAAARRRPGGRHERRVDASARFRSARMGLMIGSLVSGSAAPGYANLIYLPGCYLSGMFFPLPESMYWQAPIWPQFHVNQLAMHAAGITKFQFEPLQMAIAAHARLHRAVQRASPSGAWHARAEWA